MARLPQPGGDQGTWGEVLNDFLSESHNLDGTLKDVPQSKVTGLSASLSAKADVSAIPTTAEQVGAEPVGLSNDTIGSIEDLIGQAVSDKADIAVQNIVETGRLSPRNAAKRVGNRLALLGDSITNQNYNPAVTDNPPHSSLAIGYMAWANVLLRQRFTIVGPSATDAEFGTSGQTARSMLLDGDANSAAASAADIVIVAAGTNDLSSGSYNTGVEIASSLAAIWDILLASGKTVIATTILPRSSATAAGAHAQMRIANILIRKYAAERPNVYLCDWYPALVNPTTGYVQADYAPDGIHPNVLGARRMAEVLVPILGGLYPPIDSDLGANDADANELCPNPCMTGTTGGKSGASTGIVATDWTLYSLGAPASITGSKVARQDVFPGEWQQVLCSATSVNADGFILQAQNVAVGTEWSVGDVVYAAVEFETDESGWDGRSLSLHLNNFGGAFEAVDLFNGGSTTRLAIPAPMLRPRSGILRTIPFVIPAGTTRLQPKIIFYGSGTIRIGRCTLKKVVA